MKRYREALLIIAALQVALVPDFYAGKKEPESVKREFELWYKGYKGARSEESSANLPPIYYGLIRGFDLEPRLNKHQDLKPTITLPELASLKPGERFDKAFFGKNNPIPDSLILLSEKEKPTDEDLVNLFLLPTNKSLLLRFRPLEPKEKANHRFGPIETGSTSSPKPRWYVFGSQSGPTLFRNGKTESGKPLKDNLTDDDIISGKITYKALSRMTYTQLIDYLKKMNLLEKLDQQDIQVLDYLRKMHLFGQLAQESALKIMGKVAWQSFMTDMNALYEKNYTQVLEYVNKIPFNEQTRKTMMDKVNTAAQEALEKMTYDELKDYLQKVPASKQVKQKMQLVVTKSEKHLPYALL